MIAGIERLRRAGDELKASESPERASLMAAASEIWSAMFDSHQWPVELQAKAVALQFYLFRHGRIQETVMLADAAEAARLYEALLEFSEAAERLHCEATRHAVAAVTER